MHRDPHGRDNSKAAFATVNGKLLSTGVNISRERHAGRPPTASAIVASYAERFSEVLTNVRASLDDLRTLPDVDGRDRPGHDELWDVMIGRARPWMSLFVERRGAALPLLPYGIRPYSMLMPKRAVVHCRSNVIDDLA